LLRLAGRKLIIGGFAGMVLPGKHLPGKAGQVYMPLIL
jgi:hypothetical protein